ncbi:MAG: hypothetical protein H7A25_04995 [Leptospiraceae bacterium]|nr:hypothetical protein [Leptospiraceae bacterium]MCP5499235.1 hypothetical protein [Leptospiraceae bacterium]
MLSVDGTLAYSLKAEEKAEFESNQLLKNQTGFLNPNFIYKLNTNCILDLPGQAGVWVLHSPAIRTAASLLSFVSKTGESLNTIDIKEKYGKYAKVIFTYSFGENYYLLISRKSYTLSAVSFDPKNGKIGNEIHYLK